MAIGIATAIPFGSGLDWIAYWAAQDEVLFFGLVSEISGGQMPNKATGATDYLTVTGAAGSYTFQCPDTAPYLAADTDQIWHYTDDAIREVLEADLIGYDLQHTPVKYLDDAPNSIEAIMILSSDVTGTKLNKMHSDFHLPLYWSGVLNENGYVKSNRVLAQSVWTPISGYEDETIALIARFTGSPTTATKDHYNTTIKALKDGGCWAKRNAYVLYCGFDSQASLLNLKANEFNHTLAGATPPAHTAGQYFQGDGTTGYIRTNFIPTTHGGALFTLNANSWGLGSDGWHSDNLISAGARSLTGSNRLLTIKGRTGAALGYMQNHTNVSGIPFNLTAQNEIVSERTGAANDRCLLNGVQAVTGVVASVSLMDKELYVGAYNLNGSASNFNTAKWKWFKIGGALTNDEHLAEYTALKYFADNIVATL